MTTRVMSLGSVLDEEWRIEREASHILQGMTIDVGHRANCTLIQTANSIYLFLASAPAELSGLLVGGAVGECPTPARLVDAISAATGESEDPMCLRTGRRAVFQIIGESGGKRVITSPVVNVVHTQVRGL